MRVHPESPCPHSLPPVPSRPAATAAQDSLMPYFPTIMELLRGFLLTGHEDQQLVQIQSLGKERLFPQGSLHPDKGQRPPVVPRGLSRGRWVSSSDEELSLCVSYPGAGWFRLSSRSAPLSAG